MNSELVDGSTLFHPYKKLYSVNKVREKRGGGREREGEEGGGGGREREKGRGERCPQRC